MGNPQLKQKEFQLFAPFDQKSIQQADDGTIYIEGYASVYVTDKDGETVVPGAFDGMLDEYMMNPVILVNHQNNVQSVVGKAVSVEPDDVGLRIRVAIPDIKSDPVVQMVREKIQAGLLRAFSIGGMFQYDYPNITKVKLYEVSIVGVPANGYALFSVAKSMGLQFPTAESEPDQPEPMPEPAPEQPEPPQEETEKAAHEVDLRAKALQFIMKNQHLFN